MFCKNCGKELKDNDRFCRYCGAVIKPKSQVPEADQTTVQNKAPLKAQETCRHQAETGGNKIFDAHKILCSKRLQGG